MVQPESLSLVIRELFSLTLTVDEAPVSGYTGAEPGFFKRGTRTIVAILH